MCTVSWIHEASGYQLFCNRDEKLTRKPAAAPAIEVRDNVRFVSPTDGDSGGAWIATNEFGLSLCLLNGQPATARLPPEKPRSRGLLLLDLVSASGADEVFHRVSRLDLSPYAGFSLAILEPCRDAALIRWDRISKSFLPYADPYMPLISSSFDPAGVLARRHAEFRRQLSTGGFLHTGLLCLFHATHGGSADAYSPCMHREDAETVSFTWVRVGEDSADWFYKPAAPCKPVPPQTLSLALRQ